MNLYRPEALENRRRRLTGEVIVAMPHSMRGLFFALLAAFLIAAGALSSMRVARHERVTGWIVPSGGLVYIRAESGGFVSQVMVSEGQLARAGEPLIAMRLSRSVRGDGDVGSATSAALRLQASASDARLSAVLDRLSAEKMGLEGRLSILRTQLDELSSLIEIQESALAERREGLASTERNVAKGLETRLALQSAQASVRAAEESRHQTRAALLSARSELIELTSRIAAIDAEASSATADAAVARGAISERQLEARVRSAYEATAPISGRIMALHVSEGQAVMPGTTIAVLAPEGALQAELFVPSRAAGFIKAGQEVRLRYQAFPHEKFGTSMGSVISVSRTVLSPSEIPLEGPEYKEPVFRVKASVPHESIHVGDETYPIQPGMLLTADVILEERSLMEWALAPVLRVGT